MKSELYNKLISISKNAYVNDNILSSAAVVCADGLTYFGVRTSMSTFELDTPAITNAIGTAVSSGNRGLSKLFVYCDTDDRLFKLTNDETYALLEEFNIQNATVWYKNIEVDVRFNY